MADFNCPVVDQFGQCGFQSKNWPSQEIADKRGEEHLDEHKRANEFLERRDNGLLEEGEVFVPMREIKEFEQEHGIRQYEGGE